MTEFVFSKKRTKGFTLIELLIVIAIILILIAIALPNFLEAQMRAKIAKARGCLQTYRTAQEAYFTDFNIYLPDVDGGQKTNFAPHADWRNILPSVRGVNCGASEICTYMLLTSPIQYIRELCKEPFIGENDSSVTFSGKSVAYFEYGTYLSGGVVPGMSNQTRENYVSGLRYGLQYVMISLGPDLQYNYNYTEGWTFLGRRHFFGPSPAYSPTNGTRSIGDLIVSNRGHEG